MTPKKPQQQGFTLIELMIVVVIVGILSAIAIPSYNKYITQSRRAEAQAYMMEYAMALEKYRANCPTYNVDAVTSFTASSTNPCVDTGNAAKMVFNESPTGSFYNFSLASASTVAYTIRATPISGSVQAIRDTACPQLNLTQAGAKTPTDCWKK